MKVNELKQRIFKLTEEAKLELEDEFGKGQIESIRIVTKEAEIIHLRFPGENIVETNRCDGTFSVYEVPNDPSCCPDRKFLDIEVPKTTIDPNNSSLDNRLIEIVKEKTERKVVSQIVNSALVIYENSGCDCTGGICEHW
ncbi:MAG: hypothetical protein L3J75_15020 [Methylococcaceae bacterium]|nr:hypothetical protein [Methylococcaceae bacterium]